MCRGKIIRRVRKQHNYVVSQFREYNSLSLFFISLDDFLSVFSTSLVSFFGHPSSVRPISARSFRPFVRSGSDEVDGALLAENATLTLDCARQGGARHPHLRAGGGGDVGRRRRYEHLALVAGLEGETRRKDVGGADAETRRRRRD